MCPKNSDTLVMVVVLASGLYKDSRVIKDGEGLEGQWKTDLLTEQVP